MSAAPLDLDKSGRVPQTHRVWLGPSIGWIYADEPYICEFIMNGGSNVVASGYKGHVIVPEWVTIVTWVLIATVTGTVQMDIWKTSLQNFLSGSPPVPGESICGGNYPAIANGVAASNSVLAGWDKDINQNDVLAFNINSVSTISHLTLALICNRVKGQH